MSGYYCPKLTITHIEEVLSLGELFLAPEFELRPMRLSWGTRTWGFRDGQYAIFALFSEMPPFSFDKQGYVLGAIPTPALFDSYSYSNYLDRVFS